MSDNREDSLLELYERIKVNRVDLGLTSFQRTPTEPIIEEDMPCVFMLEGIDNIISFSKRSSTGYPVKRSVEITLELVAKSDFDIKTALRDLRRVVFTERDTDPSTYNPRLLFGNLTGYIQESRTEGPTGYGLQDVLGMNLVLDLIYIEDIL